jgi:hypothetical protein
MNPIDLARQVALLVAELLGQRMEPAVVAKRLLNAALATGLPETMLASFLTEAARARQEALFELAKARKLAGQ